MLFVKLFYGWLWLSCWYLFIVVLLSYLHSTHLFCFVFSMFPSFFIFGHAKNTLENIITFVTIFNMIWYDMIFVYNCLFSCLPITIFCFAKTRRKCKMQCPFQFINSSEQTLPTTLVTKPHILSHKDETNTDKDWSS